MRKGLLLIALFLLAQAQGFAQITLSQSSVGAIGSVYYMGVDEVIDSGTTVGPAGASQAWDFSGLNIDSRDTVRFLDPAATPYASSFPGANLCIQQSSLGAGLAYLVSSSTSLEIIGLAGDPGGLNQIFIIPQSPSLTVAAFPFTYQDSFLDTTEIDLTIDGSAISPFLDSVRYQSIVHRDLLGDAWGDLTLWSGTFNTLRVKEVSTTYDSIWVLTFLGWNLWQDSSYTDSSFTWWDNASGYLLCQADYLGPDFNEIRYQNPNPVAVSPGIFDAAQVYPNPASDRIIIAQPGQDFEVISILDLQGKVLKQAQLSGVRDEININDLPAGLYIYRIFSKDQTHAKTGKLQVIH
ncbi:MAG TPA: T9SS type A sorting domain-containing protein [Bacteroidetes bacterium]|nr:T9SS type A sorting domain-containing protein [Bacteroidota bacterium]